MMRYIKATKDVIKLSFERLNRYTWDYSACQTCTKCGWKIECVDDCVITSSADFWEGWDGSRTLIPSDYSRGTGGIYHKWCRVLCQECNETLTSPHTECDKNINAKIIEQKALEADELMVRTLTK